MNCIIVDDSDLALKATEQCVKSVSYLNLIGSFTSPVEALSFIAQNNVDLIFLDVEMPVISGIDFIKSLVKPMPQIILTTMHKNYAFDAFENNATDFLVKPISLPRFIQAISKAKSVFDKMNVSYSDETSIFIKKGSSIVKMDMSDILWIEGLGDYVTINTAKEKIVVHSTMQSIEEKLVSGKFLRVHRSYLIQKDKIIDIEDDVITYYDQLIPIGKTYKKEVYKKLNLV